MNKYVRRALIAAVWIGLWQGLMLMVGLPKLLPGPADTLRAWIALAGTGEFWLSVGMTLLRVAAGYLCAVLIIDVEQCQPAIVKLLLLGCRQSVSIGVVLLLELVVLLDSSTTESLRIRQHIDVKLCNRDFHTTGSKGVDALLVFVKIRIVQTIVALHAYSINAQPFGLQILHQTADSFTLFGTRH